MTRSGSTESATPSIVKVLAPSGATTASRAEGSDDALPEGDGGTDDPAPDALPVIRNGV